VPSRHHTTGQQCGTIAAAYGDHQYLTTGMAPSRGGDSGAPVWTIAADGHAQVIGIWLGGRTTGDGQDYGRFGALRSAVATLGVAAAD
jgi:V8-like Glu-specific endopeptidase